MFTAMKNSTLEFKAFFYLLLCKCQDLRNQQTLLVHQLMENATMIKLQNMIGFDEIRFWMLFICINKLHRSFWKLDIGL